MTSVAESDSAAISPYVAKTQAVDTEEAGAAPFETEE